MKSSNHLENKTSSDTYGRVQLVCKKVQDHSSLKPPLEYNQDQVPLKIKVFMTFLTIIGVTEILCSFRLVLEGKTGKEIPESSRSEFLGKFYANNFVLSDAEENNLWLLNRGSLAELPFLRILLAIHENTREPSFWELMDSFAL